MGNLRSILFLIVNEWEISLNVANNSKGRSRSKNWAKNEFVYLWVMKKEIRSSHNKLVLTEKGEVEQRTKNRKRSADAFISLQKSGLIKERR